MKTLKITFLSALLAVLAIQAAAQSRTISGRVTDPYKGPVVDALVTTKGSKTETRTNTNGVFTITVDQNDNQLIFTSENMDRKVVKVPKKDKLSITMEYTKFTPGQVISNGYSSTSRERSTTSVGIVDPEKVNMPSATNIYQLIAGRVSGVTVNENTGSVSIRGVRSIQGNNEPLWIVDGMQVPDPSFVNPKDVKEITVLKDAGDLSMYGSRGSNGVILIRTK